MASHMHSRDTHRASRASCSKNISILEMVNFIKSTYIFVIVCGAFGVIMATIYLAITPSKYEAFAQISMAQISVSDKNNGGGISPMGINIEEPSLLIARLSSPTSFGAKVLAACGLGEDGNSASILAKSIKISPTKGVANVVDLKAFGESPKAANNCALAIFEHIKTTQSQIIQPYIQDAKLKLNDDEERLLKVKQFVARADKSGQAMGASYLATRDEIRYLLDEITALKNMVISNETRATRLISPIYTSDVPVAPKKQITLLAGLFVGLLLGLILAITRQGYIILRRELKNPS